MGHRFSQINTDYFIYLNLVEQLFYLCASASYLFPTIVKYLPANFRLRTEIKQKPNLLYTL